MTKDKKTQIRIDPQLAQALAIVAAYRKTPGYIPAEEAVREYLATHHPDLIPKLQSTH